MKTTIACIVSALLGVGVTAVATSSAAGPPVVHFRPTSLLAVDGYGYSCQTTARTPNFGCWYGPPDGPASTPSFTVARGSRTMRVQSTRRPVITRANGLYQATITR